MRNTTWTHKQRGNYPIGGCINKIPCKLYGERCDKCVNKSEYKPKAQQQEEINGE